MDKNTVIGLVLIFAVFIGFTLFNQPSKEEIERQQQVKDSLELVKLREDSIRQMQQAKTIAQPVQETLPERSDSLSPNKDNIRTLTDKLGVFALAANGEKEEFVIENDLMKLRISNFGGKIINAELKDYKTYDSLPLVLFNNDDAVFGYTFFANSRRINTNELFFLPCFQDSTASTSKTMKVSGEDTLQFAMRLYTTTPDGTIDSSRYIEYVYVVRGNDYMIDYKLNLIGMNKIIDPGTGFIDLTWHAEMRRQEQSLENERNESTIYWKFDKESVDYLTERKDGEKELNMPLKWISFKTRFFLATLIADQSFTNAEIKTYTDPHETDNYYLKTMSALIGVPYNYLPNDGFDMKFYFGPNKYKTLKKYKLDLQRQIPLGWSFFLMAWINIYAVIPVFDWLGGYGLNYGIVILILTILLKIVLFPIAYKTYKSSAKMRVLKPEIEEIGKKFPKPEDAMKKQQATMALYKKAGVNPMAGCVPMLLQFPILLAMYRFFPSSIELRQQSFLWAHDLSSYDSILNLPFNIPFYGSHVSLFTLLMTISTIIYTKVNNDMMGSTNQMPGMKTMMYIMPVMFLGIFNNFASGLSYYYFLANILTFAQMFLIRRTIDEEKIHQQIQLNKAKPVKKSKFQTRLEELARERQRQVSGSKKK
ncbi:MAG TPA: membrane protein insertase YidC [Bacteroidales bacterium]|nr:membrane protein insertase YidC [Bacteroidales bacterium]